MGAGFEQRIRTQLASRIGHAALLVERITVRFEDINGPRGGVDTVCRIKVVVAGRPSILVEKKAASHDLAFSQAAAALATSFRRTKGKHELTTGRRARGPSGATRARVRGHDEGELIGRRVGRGHKGLARALRRPEKSDRAYYVDTAEPGKSASDRRAGGPYTARRNTMARDRRAASSLEDSRTRPSRKSTRRSANRGKPSQAKERAAAAKMMTPQAKAKRNVARRSAR